MTTEPTILIVEDNAALADMYTEWLAKTYAVRTAYDGATALELFNDDVDVVLIDRLMPEMSGDELLEAIHTRDVDCRAAMITAVEPDLDVVDLPFDDYLVKPVFEGDLYQTIETLLTRSTYSEVEQERRAARGKQSLLDQHLSDSELSNSDEYSTLARRAAAAAHASPDSSADESHHLGTLFRRLERYMEIKQ